MRKILLLLTLTFYSLLLFSQDKSSAQIWTDGIAYLKESDYLLGIEKMSEYIAKNSDSPYAYYNRGFARYHMGDLDGACMDLNESYRRGYTKNKKLRSSLCDEVYQAKHLNKFYYPHTTLSLKDNYRPTYSLADTLRGMLRPERTCFDVGYYDLTVRVMLDKKQISGLNKINFKVISETWRIQLDLFENMLVDSILWNASPLSFTREFNAVWVDFPHLLEMNSNHSLQVYYHGQPHRAIKPPWDGGFVWSRDKFLNHWVGVSCEQIGASLWWPNKDHLSDKPDSMAIRIEVPRRFQAVANGSLAGVESVSDNYLRYNWHVNYPINNYNVTFYLGKYTEFVDTIVSDTGTLLARYHVLPYNLNKAKEHFKQVHDIIPFYNKAFGFFPFPKDNFRMVESPYEGMEHQTAIAYGNAYNNKKNSDFYINKSYDYIIIHEAAHEWWGNAVTVGDMADAWIHEGFATYAEYMFLENQLGYQASLEEIRNHFGLIYNFWPMVQNRDVNEDSFAGGDIYMKGSTMLHCLRSRLDNDSLFFQMIRSYNMDHRYKIVDTDGFINYVNDYFGQDFTALLSKYLYDKDLPVLEYTYERKGPDIILKYRWTEVHDSFSMPFSVAYAKDKSIRLLATISQQEVVLENTTTFRFYGRFGSLENIPHNSLSYFWTKNRIQ